MTTEEAREVRGTARALAMAVALVWARRLRCDPRGARWDWHATARRSCSSAAGGDQSRRRW